MYTIGDTNHCQTLHRDEMHRTSRLVNKARRRWRRKLILPPPVTIYHERDFSSCPWQIGWFPS
jgi:hypothetical protein